MFIYTKAQHYINEDANKTVAILNLLDAEAMNCRRVPNNMTDYEDAVIVETAMCSGCDCIVSRNQKDYNNASIPSYSPSDYL